MSDIEKIQFGEQTFDLVAGGANLNGDGGSVTFRIGNSDFNAIKANLKLNKDITKINTSGEIGWCRSDLVYAGRLSNIENYDIGAGVKEDVLIAEFRLPDTREKIKDLTADVAYLSMMSGIDLGVTML